MNIFLKRITVIISIIMMTLLTLPSHAAVSVTKGKTEIPDGNAISAGDITVKNNKLAFAIAVESAPPWGVARGSIVDIATITNGKMSIDRVAYADFIPNSWSSWPTTYQQVEITKDTPEEAIITSVRDFGDVTIRTVYSLKADSDIISATTTMTNEGADLPELVSGFTLWPDGGYKFAIPGYAGVKETKVENAMADRFVAYDREWSIALHAPYFTEVKYGSRDLYMQHSLKKGESRSFEGHYQVNDSGDISGVVQAEIKRKNLDYGTLSGDVKDNRKKAVSAPAIIISKDGVPYIWVIGEKGKYSIDLPVGDYEAYATSGGYSNSKTQKISIAKGKVTDVGFKGLGASGKLSITVTDKNTKLPLDAKIQIEEGNSPLIEFLGAKTFYTEIEPVGTGTFNLAPGSYKLKISHGDNFLAPAALIDVKIASGKTKKLKSTVDVASYPTKQGWYSGDLHHHADVLEGTTPAEYVVRSQLAAGLSVTFISDHDSTKNFAEIKMLSDKRNVTFIPSIELSPSWGHFNPFPLDLDAKLTIDPGVDDVHIILEYANSVGAMAIAANHPYIPYGYLTTLTNNTAPGGLNPAFDFLELNKKPDDKTVKKAHDLWSKGLKYYYTAGSDAHDVWNDVTGVARMYVHSADGGKPTPESFTQAMKDGHAYASFGPLIYPKNVMFGDTLRTYDGGKKKVISFDLVAVNGLKSAKLISESGVVKEIALKGNTGSVDFEVPNIGGWIALEIVDSQDKKALSNPIWLEKVTLEHLTTSAKTE